MGAVIVQYQAEKKQYKDLPSGQYYFDTCHHLCMKLNNGDGVDGRGDCIFLEDDGSWALDQEELNDYVEPVQATLLIEGAE
jgi:hypothetical protein